MDQWTPSANPSSLADLFPPGTDLCQIPAGQPPRGEVVDFNDPGLRDVTIAVGVISTSAAVFLGVGRLYANLRKYSLSDLFVFLAILLNIAQVGLMIGYVRYFRHDWDIRLCWLNAEFMKISYVWPVIYVFSQYFAKSATLMLFYQLFTISKPMRTAIRAGLIFAFVFYAAGLAISSYYSTPRNGRSWTETMLDSMGSISISLYWAVIQGALGTVFDLYIFILPLPIVFRLKLSTKKRIQVTALFMVALLGVVASIVSLVFRTRSIQGPEATDVTYYTGVLMICNLVEMNVAVIVCSTPACARLVRIHVKESRVLKNIRSTWEPSGGDGSLHPTADSSAQEWSHASTATTDSKKKRESARDMGSYIEMNDTWLPKAAVPTEEETPRWTYTATSQDKGLRVTRTVDVEHTIVYSRP
ncbi:hypothetical protein S40285_02572 [Stachybotrys chlorohalonatus IBT 40285]|uniref:Rhodopsin domain-containing protein n=1 Tax=Stachybotrys chlorohalonatus (strain IBT 40285) TaxID=1283841 RepID=A0A084QVU7_STAC4|nr:hypothetical protein S40285_02572 [Stachybotrys chlorohalonata IBT 40285]